MGRMRRFAATARLLVVAATGVMAVGCSSSSAPSVTARFPNTPVPVPWHQGPASKSFAHHMLHATDFGAGWYEDYTPAIPKVRALPPGGRAGAMTMLSKAHRTPDGWASDVQITEHAIDFAGPAQAQRYVRSWITYANASNVPVITPGRRGGFVVANRAYLLSAIFYSHPTPDLSTERTNLRGAKRVYALAKRIAMRAG